MKILFHTLFFCVFAIVNSNAQFAPQVGLLGSTAIHKSNSSLKAWANKCSVQRGFIDIANPSLGFTTAGESNNALGIADGEIVSLGDSGVATIQFDFPLYNGSGADLVIFENGFANPANIEEAFLELAFVEISSDGEHFFRFPTTSNTPIDSQIKGAGAYMNARLINNLAGKYTAQNGTPFDFEELKGTIGLDVDNISYVRIIDVVGAINGNSSTDFSGQKINDPYPTPFPTGGFDLDAVAAIHTKSTSIAQHHFDVVKIYPNPATEQLFVELQQAPIVGSVLVLRNIIGEIVWQNNAQKKNEILINTLPSGLYFIGIQTEQGVQWIGKCSKI